MEIVLYGLVLLLTFNNWVADAYKLSRSTSKFSYGIKRALPSSDASFGVGETSQTEITVSGREGHMHNLKTLMGSAFLATTAASSSAMAAAASSSFSADVSSRALTEEQGRILFEPFSTHVEKSQGDDREYRSLTLSNDLRVLLISDPATSIAAAAIDVHVGSTSDPEDVPGLAHFCEHMSFLGTKKYPKEDDFSGFLSSHGGATNAYTDQEDTVYYFDVSAEFLGDGLDRFSQFFIAPTFTQDGTDRELNAIESEHSKNINDDGFRLFQLEKDMSNPSHPFHKFSTGNKQTLEAIPKTRGVDVREELLTFHEKFYSANQMTLCIYGKQGLDTLEKWTRAHFTGVPNRGEAGKGVGAPELQWWGKVSPYPYATTSGAGATTTATATASGAAGAAMLPPLVEVVPAGASRRLSVQWPIWVKTPSRAELLHHAKPETIVSHLLGHEGQGSLRALLVDRGLANGLRASIGTDLSDLITFEVSVDLTEEGFKRRYEVVHAIYAYISLLKGEGGEEGEGTAIPPYIFEEVEQLSRISFEFAEKNDPEDYVSALVADMQTYRNPAEYLTGPHLFKAAPGVTDREVRQFLEALRPSSGQLFVIGKEFEGKTRDKQAWYNTDYNRLSLSQAQLKSWEGARAGGAYSSLRLPRPNELIPRDFTLVGGQGSVADAKNRSKQLTADERKSRLEQPPHRILDRGGAGALGERWEVWHKLDVSFQQPRMYAIISLAIDATRYDPAFVINSRLFTQCFMDSVNEYLYEARLAGLNFDLEFTGRGVQVLITGFSEKLPEFADTMLGLLKNFTPDPATYRRYRDVQKRELLSWKSRQPYYHANYFATQVMETLQFSISSLEAALSKATIGMLDGFLTESVGVKSHGSALFAGNVEVEGARRVVELVDAAFPFAVLPEAQRSRRRALQLPLSLDGTAPAPELYNIGPNPNDENSCSAFYFQLPSRRSDDTVLVELLADIVEQPFYDSLRTRQQLGYIVYAGVKAREGFPSLLFVVQSSLLDGPQLSERIAEFLFDSKYLPSIIDGLSDSAFDAFKAGIRTQKLEPDQRLTSQAGRFWAEISSQELPEYPPLFDRSQREVNALDKVTKAGFQTFARDFLAGARRRLLVSEVTSPLQNKGKREGSATAPLVNIEKVDGAKLRLPEL
jgi:insulysin